MVEVGNCFWGALWLAYPNKIKGKILLDNDQTSYDLWSKMLATQEATNTKNECDRDVMLRWTYGKNRKDIIRNE